MPKVGVSFASNEVSELSPKYNNEYNKEYNIERVSFEPELPEGSGSKDVDEKERQRGLKILRDAINN